MLDANDLQGAGRVEQPVEGNVVGMQDKLAHVGLQHGPALMAERVVLGQRLDLFAQLLAEGPCVGGTVLGDVANDAAQVL